MKHKSFRSLNSSPGWLGIAASQLCAFYSSYLQHRVPTASFSDLFLQIESLRHLRKLGLSIFYTIPPSGSGLGASILVFSDARKKVDPGQTSVLAGLLFGEAEKDNVLHGFSWISQRSKHPVKFIGAAEILAACKSVFEGKCFVLQCQLYYFFVLTSCLLLTPMF